jgi:hypothetical protein
LPQGLLCADVGTLQGKILEANHNLKASEEKLTRKAAEKRAKEVEEKKNLD